VPFRRASFYSPWVGNAGDSFKDLKARGGSPAGASRRRRPCSKELAKQDNPSEVIGIVCRQTLQLFANRHDADRITGARGATNQLFQFLLITRHHSGLLVASEETLA
jgi:hypothetical protein